MSKKKKPVVASKTSQLGPNFTSVHYEYLIYLWPNLGCSHLKIDLDLQKKPIK
jgi:hypothetical protein